jgi:hypothetical protein
LLDGFPLSEWKVVAEAAVQRPIDERRNLVANSLNDANAY